MNIKFRRYISISWLARIIIIWLFAYIFSLCFVSIYGEWLSAKVDSYADSLGFIFNMANDAPSKPPEFKIYLSALNRGTWRSMYIFTGVIISLIIGIFVEVIISIFSQFRKYTQNLIQPPT